VRFWQKINNLKIPSYLLLSLHYSTVALARQGEKQQEKTFVIKTLIVSLLKKTLSREKYIDEASRMKG
jgi:hypothetical protein